MSNDELPPPGLVAFVTPEGRRGAIDPDSVTAVHEASPVLNEAGHIMHVCVLYVGNHAHKVLGSIEEWLRALVGDDESVEVTEAGKGAIDNITAAPKAKGGPDVA